MSRYWSRYLARAACACVLLAVVAVSASADDAADASAAVAAVRRYMGALIAQDGQAARLCCTTNPDLRPALVALTDEALGMRIAADAVVRTIHRSGDADKAAVRMISRWKAGDRTRVLSLDFRVDREPAGWLLQGTRDALDYVKGRLVSAQDADARRQAIADNEELVDGLLALQLREDATELSRQGKHDDALRSSAAAFAVAEHMRNDYELGYCYLNRGTLRKRRTEWNPALADYEAARRHFAASNDKEGQAKTQTNAAAIYSHLGLTEKALRFYENGLKVFREIRDEAAEAAALQDIGVVLKSMGRPEEALKWNSEARAIRARRKERAKEAVLMANEAGLLGDLGRHAEAIKLFNEALTILREEKDTAGAGYALNNLANTLQELGQTADARARFIEARAAFVTAGDKFGQMMALHNLAGLQARAGDTDTALENGLAAAKLAEEIDERLHESQSLGLLQQVLLETREYAQALAYTQPRLDAARSVGNRAQECAALLSAGFALTRLGRYEEARRRLDEARALSTTTASLQLQQHVWGCLGDLAARERNWPEACRAYDRAVAFVETSRNEAREQSLRTSLLRQHIPIYRSLIHGLAAMGRTPDAFAASERAKARSLMDLMQGGKIDLSRDLGADERRREQGLVARIGRLGRELESAVTTDEIEALKTQLADARKEMDDFRVALYLKHPALESRSAAFQPAALRAIDAAILAPDPGAAVVSYVFTADTVFTFVIHRPHGGAARLDMYRVAAPVDRVRALAEELMRGTSTPRGDWARPARALHSLLVSPAAPSLSGKTHLAIVPDPSAPPLPFAVLLDGRDRPLASRYSLSYAPSVTALVRMVEAARARTHTGAELLAVGAPAYSAAYAPLPATADEVRRIAGVARGRATVVTGASATRAAVCGLAERARIVHLATHGIIDTDAPMRSAVVLTPSGLDDGLLRARDMADLRLTADLVVLSACETALGRQVGGEGALGLTWALFVGGATAVAATQWRVYDESTRTLMVDFYRRFYGAGARRRSAAEALRQAQMGLRAGRRTSHPYYWAPFTLSGAWTGHALRGAQSTGAYSIRTASRSGRGVGTGNGTCPKGVSRPAPGSTSCRKNAMREVQSPAAISSSSQTSS